LFIYSLPEALIHSTTFPDGIEPVFLFYSIPIPRFQAGRRMRLSTNSWRRVCKHMSRAKQNRKDYSSQLYTHKAGDESNRWQPRRTDQETTKIKTLGSQGKLLAIVSSVAHEEPSNADELQLR